MKGSTLALRGELLGEQPLAQGQRGRSTSYGTVFASPRRRWGCAPAADHRQCSRVFRLRRVRLDNRPEYQRRRRRLHVLNTKPADLWVTRFDKRFRERAADSWGRGPHGEGRGPLPETIERVVEFVDRLPAAQVAERFSG